MKKLLPLFIIFLIATFGKSSFASHNAGGYITYTNVGRDSFMVTITLLRDCNGSSFGPGLEQLVIRNPQNLNTIETYILSIPNPIDITPRCQISCSRCESSGCSFPYGVEKYDCTQLVVLNTSICEVLLTYKMCCRPNTISTGMAGGNLWLETKLNKCNSPQNSSPKPLLDPVTIVCIGQDQSISFFAPDQDIDKNGNSIDSISYEFTNPMGSGGSNLSYSGQYDYNKPVFFWGFPNVNLPSPRGFHLDPQNGILHFRPMKVEETVVGIKINEFRNGVKIGEIKMDFLLYVISCPNNQAPLLSGPFIKTFCEGDTVAFNIRTLDYDPHDTLSMSYFANIPGATFTIDSNHKHPTGIFNWIPKNVNHNKLYSFKVMVSDNSCPVRSSTLKIYYFKILKKPDSVKIRFENEACYNYNFQIESRPKQINDYTTFFNTNPYTYYYDDNFTAFITGNRKIPIEIQVNDTSLKCSSRFYDTIEITQPYDIYPLDSVFNCFIDTYELIPNTPPNNKSYVYVWHQYKSSNYSKETAQTLKISVEDETKIVIEAIDTASNCKIYDTVIIKYYEGLVDAGTDLVQCISSDSIPLLGKPFSVSSFWTGKNVKKVKDTFYFFTDSCYNGEENYFYYHFVDGNCKIIDSVKITVFEKTWPIMEDIVDACITVDSIKLVATPANGRWYGINVRNGYYINNPKKAGPSMAFYTTGSSHYGCEQVSAQIIRINPLQNFEFQTNKETYCMGDDILINAKNVVANFEWYKSAANDGHFSLDSSEIENQYIPGSNDLKNKTIKLYAKTTDSICPGIIKTLNLYINENPVADFTASTTSGLIPLTINFTNNSYSNDGKIILNTWDFGNDQHSMDINPLFTYNQIGVFDVSLNVETDSGCYDTIIKQNYINALPSGISELEKYGLTIYPNPFTSKILIKSEKPIQTIRLINFEGKIVLDTEVKENQTELSTENLAKGIYLLKIEMEAGEVYRQTLIKI
jgi:PKD repeat protein